MGAWPRPRGLHSGEERPMACNNQSRSWLRTIGAAVLAACALIVLAGCSAVTLTTVQEAEAQRKLEAQVSSPAIVEDGKLRIGLLTSNGVPELVEAGGAYEGIDVTAGAALAQALGLEAVFVPVESAADATAQNVDVVMGVDSSTAGDMVVVSTYLESATGVFARGDSPEVPIAATDLGGTTVGVQTNSLSAHLLDESDLLVTQKGYDTLDEAFEALRDGSVDYVVSPALPGGYLAHRFGDMSLAGLLDVPSTIGVGVSAANTELQEKVQAAMDSLVSGGVIAVARSQWVGSMPALTADLQIKGVTFTAKDEGTPVPTDVGTGNGADSDGVSVPSSGAMDGSTAGSNAVTDIG